MVTSVPSYILSTPICISLCEQPLAARQPATVPRTTLEYKSIPSANGSSLRVALPCVLGGSVSSGASSHLKSSHGQGKARFLWLALTRRCILRTEYIASLKKWDSYKEDERKWLLLWGLGRNSFCSCGCGHTAQSGDGAGRATWMLCVHLWQWEGGAMAGNWLEEWWVGSDCGRHLFWDLVSYSPWLFFKRNIVCVGPTSHYKYLLWAPLYPLLPQASLRCECCPPLYFTDGRTEPWMRGKYWGKIIWMGEPKL